MISDIFPQTKYMHFGRFILCALLFVTINVSAQHAVDITPNPGGNYRYLNAKTDGKGNFYVTQMRDYNDGQVMKYNGTEWTDINKNFSGKANSLFVSGDDVYGIGYSSNFYFPLNHWNGTSWDTISTVSLGGNVRSVAKLPNGQLVVKGQFRGNEGNFYLATLKDGIWVRYDTTPVDDSSIAHALEKNLSKDIVVDKKGNVFVYCWGVYPGPYNQVILAYDGKWKKLFSSTEERIHDIAVGANGIVYAGTETKKENAPSTFMLWTGTEWKWVSCPGGVYNCDLMATIAVNDAGEPMLAGNNKSGTAYAILQYANTSWTEFASLPSGPVEMMVYSTGSLFAITKDCSRIWKIPKGSKVDDNSTVTSSSGGTAGAYETFVFMSDCNDSRQRNFKTVCRVEANLSRHTLDEVKAKASSLLNGSGRSCGAINYLGKAADVKITGTPGRDYVVTEGMIMDIASNSKPAGSISDCLSGDCVNGRGTYQYPSGNKYAGDFKDRKREGSGTFYFANGDQFTGTWYNNEKRNGTYSFSNGARYTGSYNAQGMELDGTMTGNGVVVPYVNGVPHVPPQPKVTSSNSTSGQQGPAATQYRPCCPDCHCLGAKHETFAGGRNVIESGARNVSFGQYTKCSRCNGTGHIDPVER
jgi:hypothetical protein